MSESTDQTSWWTRPRIVVVAIAAVAIVAAIAVVIALTVGAGRGGPGGPGSSGSSGGFGGSPTSDGPATPTSLDGTGATGTPAPVDEEVEPTEGVTISVAELTAVEGEPAGIGELAGPAVRVLLNFENATGETVPLSAAVVNLYFGGDNSPAVPVSGPDAFPFPAEVAPGDTVQGAYVFTVPVESRDSVTVVVEYAPGVAPVAFQGPAPR